MMEKRNQSTSFVRSIELKKLIAEELEIDPKKIKLGDKFRDDLGLRNIGFLGIIYKIEIKFKTGQLKEEEIRKVTAVKDLLKLINQKKS